MGKIIKPYEVISQLGQGGMGVVYKARSITLKNKVVAIKQLWPQFNNNPLFVKLFLDEGEKLFNLDHKNIVKVTDILEEGGEYFIVMEYVEGRTLNEIIKREVGPIQRARAINLFRQILEGVAYIHSQPKPIIHRDLKPLNILVTSEDIVKITDFGIAKELEDGEGSSTTMKGTPTYMSPEQIMDPRSVDIRTDIYSLGMTFYEMLCAKSPFSGNQSTTPTAVYTQVINDKVPPPTEFYPDISDALVNFVMKSIHKDREQRFPNAIEMLHELDRLERGGQTTVQGEGGFASMSVPKQETDVKTPSPIVPQKSGTEQLTGNEMVFVEGGSFMMGSNSGDPDEKPEHPVTVSDFFIGKVPVTQKLWREVMGNYPSYFTGDKRPVECVSWHDAIEFCNRLSRKEGLRECYSEIEQEKGGLMGSLIGQKAKSLTCDFKANGYRLPREAEWEYSARGGNQSKGYEYSGSNDLDEVGRYGGWNDKGNRSEEEGTALVGKKIPNELGIYDMSGNVWEWCWDLYDSSGSFRVLRGGSWYGDAEYCRVAYRGSFNPDSRNSLSGFRLSRTR